MTNTLTKFLLLPLIMGLPCYLSAAVGSSSNTPELINEDGCVCKLSGPKLVCPGEQITVHASIYHEDGSSEEIKVNYPIAVSGIAGSTASPKAITKCPDEKDINITVGSDPAGGELTVKVGNCTHKIKVLTSIVGQWTTTYDPNPSLPSPNPTVTQFSTPWVEVPSTLLDIGFKYSTYGTITSTFSVVREPSEWKPSATGTECGESATISYIRTYTDTIGGEVSVSINIGELGTVNIPIGGVSNSWSNVVTLEKSIGGPPKTRWRAYPVYPVANSVLNGQLEKVYDSSPTPVTEQITKNLGTSVVAGKDWHEQAACCQGSD